MRFRRWSSGLVAAVVALGVPAPISAAAPSSELPRLARRTVIVGSDTAWTDVFLAEDIAPVRNMEYEVTGDGRLTGFVIVKHGSAPLRRRPALIALRSGRCLEVACEGRPQPLMFMFGFNLVDHELPAGRYRVFLIADGAPVRVQLDVPELRGRTTLQPRTPAEAQIESLESTVPAAPNLLAAGRSTELRGDGISSVTAWAHSETEVAGVLGGCFYREDPPPEPFAYAPGCPEAAGEPKTYGPNVPPAADGPVYQGIDLRLDRALGAYYSTASAPEELGAIAFWLKV